MLLAQEFGNVQCFCMTTTPIAFFEKYGSMNVLPIENTTNPDYHGWCDNHIELRGNEHRTEPDAVAVHDEHGEAILTEEIAHRLVRRLLNCNRPGRTTCYWG